MYGEEPGGNVNLPIGVLGDPNCFNPIPNIGDEGNVGEAAAALRFALGLLGEPGEPGGDGIRVRSAALRPAASRLCLRIKDSSLTP